MKGTAVLVLLAQQALPAAAAAPGVQCLPGQDGFLSMRLRGSIEADINWREPGLECTGMPRPDGKGFRVRFAGKLPAGGGLSVLFAAPDLAAVSRDESVPVNVTLIDGAGERIYGTQGDSRCQFDEVEQVAIDHDAFPKPSFRVNARGFCVAPARALDGDGAVMLTRFDFAGIVTSGDEDADPPPAELPPHFAMLPQGRVRISTRTGTHDFEVWIAADDASRERGLMHVSALGSDRGMLFVFDPPRPVSFWMKDTPVPLDILFIAPDGRITNIARDTKPHSLEPISSTGAVRDVLEVAAGTADRLGISAGDRIERPHTRSAP